MALNTKAVLVAALLGSTMPAAAVWAQATPTTPETPGAETPNTATPSPTTATEEPAAVDNPAPAEPATPEPATPEPAAPVASGAAQAPADAPAAAPAGAPAAPAAAAGPGANVVAAPAPNRDAAADGGFYLDSTHGEWQVRCQKAPNGQDPCELYQLLSDAQNNPVAEISLIPLSGQAVAGVTMVAPLETDLLPGLGFQVDGGNQVAYPFNFCAQVGCFSRVAFTQAEVDGLRRGNAGKVTLVPYGAPENTRVDLTLSLTGFTAGWDAVRAKTPAAPVQGGAAPTVAPGTPPAAAPATGPAPATPPAN